MVQELSFQSLSICCSQWPLFFSFTRIIWCSPGLHTRSPIVYSVYIINSLADLDLSPGSSIILYADDILLYRTVSSDNDSALLQHDADAISSWIHASGLAINPTKCSLLIISRKRLKPSVSLRINSINIPLVNSVKYLGITISSDLKSNAHIASACKSAKQKLGLLYRNFHQADKETLTHLYKSLVLPKLDYCSSVWDPHTAALANSLESVQSLAARVCCKCRSVPSSSLITSLNWPSLRLRRQRQKAQLFRRIIRSESIIPPSYYHPAHQPNLRVNHSQSVSVPFARTTLFQKYFFISSSILWNSLPSFMTTLTSARAFKAALFCLPSFLT